ncbi:MAG TPA: hypothetical protein VGN34_29465 [Ktedonobacteraceae bacterium]|jgi:hypothetical protein
MLSLLAEQLALAMSLSGAGTTYASPHPTSGLLKQAGQSRPCHYQVQVVESPNPGSLGNDLGGIAALSANNIWVVGGFRNTNGPSQTLIEHWNGSNWSVVPNPNPKSTDNSLNGIEALSPHNIWAVGSFLNLPSSPAHTLIEHITM